jgi:hypothetical protein
MENENKNRLSSPFKQQVFKFFREKYGFNVKIQLESDNLYFGFYDTGVAWLLVSEGTYEEVENKLIDKLIEIAKQKKQ